MLAKLVLFVSYSVVMVLVGYFLRGETATPMAERLAARISMGPKL